MFYWTIELVSTIITSGQQPASYIINKLKYDPGLNEGDELFVNWEINNKKYHLKSKVVGFQKITYFPDKKLEEWGEEAAKNGLLLHRIFVEAEDRDTIIDIADIFRNKIVDY